MTTEPPENTEEPKNSGDLDRNLLLGLDFGPVWARQSRTKRYADAPPPAPEDRRRDSRGGQTPPGRGRKRPAARQERPRTPAPRAGFEPPPPLLPVDIRLIPDQKQLRSAIRQIQAFRKAYPVTRLARLFLSKPGYCHVRIEVRRGSPNLRLYQCKNCWMVSVDRSCLVSHFLKNHAESYFVKVESVVDEPVGQFVCVARCGLTGTLLGPPNHHSYKDRVKEVIDTHFPGMSSEEYARKIGISRDPALLNQWKQEFTKRTGYKLKASSDAGQPLMKWGEVRDFTTRELIPSAIVEATKATMPATLADQIEDQALQYTVTAALRREFRAPMSLSFALRAAFRSLDLRVFQHGDKGVFVSPIDPSPLDPQHAAEPVRKLLMCLEKTPGCARAALLEALSEGLPADSPERDKLLSPLDWLIERGHVIEFHDNTLWLPERVVAAGGSAAPRPTPTQESGKQGVADAP